MKLCPQMGQAFGLAEAAGSSSEAVEASVAGGGEGGESSSLSHSSFSAFVETSSAGSAGGAAAFMSSADDRFKPVSAATGTEPFSPARTWAGGGAGARDIFVITTGWLAAADAVAAVAAGTSGRELLRSRGPGPQLSVTTAAANRRGLLRLCTAVSVTEGTGGRTADAAAAVKLRR